ncbi:hypothetical protein LguiA_003749 [Lonicera macranthoides]
MGMQAASFCLHNQPPALTFSPKQPLLSHQRTAPRKISSSFFGLRYQKPLLQNAPKSYLLPGLNQRIKESSLSRLTRGFVVYASSSNEEDKLSFSGRENTSVDGVEPFRGKSGSVSFSGITHHLVEEDRLVSAPFEESGGSFLWIWGPIALISSLLLPQFVVNYVFGGLVKGEVTSEIVTSFTSEVMFYIGLAIFLQVTDLVQKPYLQFSAKRWSLITGLKGYLTSAYFAMGIKLSAPVFAACATWPIIRFPAVVSVAPFLAGCLAQFVLESRLENRGSSSWPLVPIIFEVYRLYQLGKAANFIQRLMSSMRGAPITPELMEKSGALYGMVVTFQVVGLVCLWSLLTFLIRLFPSRPVSENY